MFNEGSQFIPRHELESAAVWTDRTFTSLSLPGVIIGSVMIAVAIQPSQLAASTA